MTTRPSRRPRPLLDALRVAAADWRTPQEIALVVGRDPRDASVAETLRQYVKRRQFERRPNISTLAAKWQYRAVPTPNRSVA